MGDTVFDAILSRAASLALLPEFRLVEEADRFGAVQYTWTHVPQGDRRFAVIVALPSTDEPRVLIEVWSGVDSGARFDRWQIGTVDLGHGHTSLPYSNRERIVEQVAAMMRDAKKKAIESSVDSLRQTYLFSTQDRLTY